MRVLRHPPEAAALHEARNVGEWTRTVRPLPRAARLRYSFPMSAPFTLDSARTRLFRVMRKAGMSLFDRLIVPGPPTADDERRARELAVEFDLPALLNRGPGER